MEEAENTASEAPAVTETQATEQPQAENPEVTEKPEGWERAEFTEDQQKRFNRVYKEMKGYQSEAYELRKIAQDQSLAIEELRKNQNQVISHIQENDFAKTENQLKDQRRAAYDAGNLALVDEINDRLADIKIEKKLSGTKQKEQPQPQPRGFGAGDAVNNAVKMGVISSNDAEVYREWAGETDENGNLLRPWVNEYDHRNNHAAIEGKAVFTNPAFVDKPFSEKLKEIDKRMGIKMKQSASSGVMGGGNLTREKNISTVKLSPEIERIAIRSQFAGRGKSPQEHIEAYRKQVLEVRRGK